MTFYQSYRKLLKDNSEEDTETKMKEFLPDRIDYNVFKFVHEVKTTKPIPWIKEFETVVDVKTEIQQKLNNELAEVFLAKEKHIDTLIKGLNQVLHASSKDRRLEIIQQLNVKSELTEKYQIAQDRLKQYQDELMKIAENETKKREDLEQHITQLSSEIEDLKNQSDHYRLIASNNSNNLEFTHFEHVPCQGCGCHGTLDCLNRGLGDVFNCPNCGLPYCRNCVAEGDICDNCKHSTQ